MRWLLLLIPASLFAQVSIQCDVNLGTPGSCTGVSVGQYDVVEFVVSDTATLGGSVNPWEDPTISMVFTPPSGTCYGNSTCTVGGFYYNGLSDGLPGDGSVTNNWRVRFAPPSTGTWTWSVSFNDQSGNTFSTSGSFTCTASSNRGFLKIHSSNKYRFTDQAGTPFYVIGLIYAAGGESGFGDQSHDSLAPPMSGYTAFSGLDDVLSSGSVSFNAYYKALATSGYNFFESLFQPNSVYDNLGISTGKNTYDVAFGQSADEFAQTLHQNGIHWSKPSIMGLCGDLGGTCPGDFYTNTTKQLAFQNLVRYQINRWGAWQDIVKICDEDTLTGAMLTTITGWIHSYDPYGHLTSNGYNDNSGGITDISVGNSFHGDSILTLDNSILTTSSGGVSTVQSAYPNRPYLYTLGPNSPAADGDPERFRISFWSSTFMTGNPLMQGSGSDSLSDLTFNNILDFGAPALQRSYATVLSVLISDLDGAAVSNTSFSTSSGVRGYIISGTSDVAGYFLHTAAHDIIASGTVTLTVPTGATAGVWVDPSTGTVLSSFTTSAGSQTLTMPNFTCDIALRLRQAPSTPVLQFTLPAASILANAGTITVSVTRTGVSTGAVTVGYATSDDTALSGVNYTGTSGTLSWGSGDSSTKAFTITLANAASALYHSDFLVKLSSPTGGATIGPYGSQVVTLTNPTHNGFVIGAGESSYQVAQNAGTYTVTVNRVGNGVGAASVILNTRNSFGGAANGTDYCGVNVTPLGTCSFISGQLNWTNGDTTGKTINIPIINSSTAYSQPFVLQLTNPVNGDVMHPYRANVVIINQTPSNNAGWLVPSSYSSIYSVQIKDQGWQYNCLETAGNCVISLSRLYGTGGSASTDITYSTVGIPGSAVAGTDYTTTSGSLSWALLDSSTKTITIPIFHNTSVLQDRDLFVEVLCSNCTTQNVADWYTAMDIRIVIQNVDGACSISPTSLGPWVTGQTISQTFTATGCSSSSWSSSGSFPTGLSLNSSTGVLSGTIGGSPGTFTPSVSYDTATNPYTIVVTAATSPAFTSAAARSSKAGGVH